MGYRKNIGEFSKRDIINIYFYYYNLAKKEMPMFAKKYIEIIYKIERKTHVKIPDEIKKDVCFNCFNLKKYCVCLK